MMNSLADLRINEMPRTLRELALERMRTAIVEQRFAPGARLVERELCTQLGVSRSVVREVIRQLESEGLIQSIPHQGPVVATLDAATAAQIYEIRAALEASAAEAAAKAASADDVARLEAALASITSAYGAEDHRAVIEATTRFYETMFLIGGKTVSWEVVQRLNGRISRLRAMTIASTGRSASGPRQMAKIVAAIRDHDAAAAGQACRQHVEQAAAIAQELLKRQES